MTSSRSGRTSHRRARGQGFVEFALVAPLLIGLAFGVFDFGRALSAYVTVTNSVKEVSRYLAAVSSSNAAASDWGIGTSGCPGSGSPPAAPPASGAWSKAWNQLAAANVDLSQVTGLNVYFYSAGTSNDPVNDTSTGHTSANLKITCTAGSSTPSMPTASPTTYTPVTGDWVVVELVYRYVTATPLISRLVPTITVDQTSTMVVE